MAGTERANVADLVRAAAVHRPDGVALVHRPETGDRTTTTWAAVDDDVEATAVGLRTELGLRTGDRVALAMGSSPAFVTAYFAVLPMGMIIVSSGSSEFRYACTDDVSELPSLRTTVALPPLPSDPAAAEAASAEW